MQRALAIVEPFGEDRADIRAKLGVLASREEIKGDDFQEIYDLLDNYTGDDEPTGELKVDAKALAKLKEADGQ